MPIETVLPGHGDAFGGHAALIDERFAMHERRARKFARADRRARRAPRTRSRSRSWGNVARHAGLPDPQRGARPRRPAARARRGASRSSRDGVVQFTAASKWTSVEVILVALLISVAVLAAAARAINVPYPIVLVLGGALLGLRARACPTSQLDPDLVLRDLPAAAAVLGGVLRQPARPARRPAADRAAVDRARDRDGRASSRSSRTS